MIEARTNAMVSLLINANKLPGEEERQTIECPAVELHLFVQ
jgi:hypothetical protein